MTRPLPSSSVCVPTRIMLDVAPNSYRAVLQTLAHQISDDLHRPYAGVIDALSKGSGAATTPMGAGILVLDQTLPGLEAPYILLARLTHPVDAHADDRQPVGLMMIVLSSDEDRIAHIRLVSRMMRTLHDSNMCDLIRGAGSEESVRVLFMSLQEASCAQKAA